MTNLCHPHEMTDLVDRFQNWRGFACPYCRIAELEAELSDYFREQSRIAQLEASLREIMPYAIGSAVGDIRYQRAKALLIPAQRQIVHAANCPVGGNFACTCGADSASKIGAKP